MIEIKNKKNKFTYNVYHVTKAFFPEEEIVQTVDEEQEPLVWMQLPGGACFSLAERSLTGTDRKMTPEEEQTEKREVTAFFQRNATGNWRGGCLRESDRRNL